jgi:hypothetical protein
MSPYDIDGARGPGGRSLVTGAVGGGGGGGGAVDGEPLAVVVDDYEDGTASSPTNSNWSYQTQEGSIESSSPINDSNSLRLTGNGSTNEVVELVRDSKITPDKIRFFMRTDEGESNFIRVTGGSLEDIQAFKFGSGGNVETPIDTLVQYNDGDVIQVTVSNIDYADGTTSANVDVETVNLTQSVTDSVSTSALTDGFDDFGGFQHKFGTEDQTLIVDDFSHS